MGKSAGLGLNDCAVDFGFCSLSSRIRSESQVFVLRLSSEHSHFPLLCLKGGYSPCSTGVGRCGEKGGCPGSC